MNKKTLTGLGIGVAAVVIYGTYKFFQDKPKPDVETTNNESDDESDGEPNIYKKPNPIAYLADINKRKEEEEEEKKKELDPDEHKYNIRDSFGGRHKKTKRQKYKKNKKTKKIKKHKKHKNTQKMI